MVLSAIAQYPTKAFQGLVEGIADALDVESWINNAATVPGISDLVFIVANTHAYTATIYGIPVSFTSSGAATAANVRDGFIAAIAAIPALTPRVSAVASGVNARITELDPETYGPMGPFTGLDADTSETVVTAHSQLEPMPAGIFVVGAATGFQSLRLPRTNSLTRLRGVVMHQHNPVNERLFPLPSRNLYPANQEISVLRRGKIWCFTEAGQTISLDSAPYMRFAASANGSQLGALRNDADGATAVQLTGFAVAKQPTSGGLTLVEVNIVP